MPTVTINIPTAQLAVLDQFAVDQGYANYREWLIAITKCHVRSQEIADAINTARVDALSRADQKAEGIR